jgi:ATP-dependent RNA helicase DeaD
MSKFIELGISPKLVRGIEEIGFQEPTPIQLEIIPLVLGKERDLVGLAQTGTGKTAAFGLPIIEQLDLNRKSVQVLILVPTRELCIQITTDLKKFSKYLHDIHIIPVYGGTSIEAQIKQLKNKGHIVVATPGRMVDLINRRVMNMSDVKTIILDEADEMLNMGFREELDHILSEVPSKRRTLLFSATMPRDVARIAQNYMSDPVQITIGKQNAGAENVQHLYYQVHARDRYLALKRLADYNPDIYGIVFCRTRAETKEVADKLIKDGYNADALHGDLSQSQRDHVMKRFRERNLHMLVATDVAARGIDVSDITHIINYNLPDDNEVYTHRSGRTGRAGKNGVSIAIVNYREKNRIPQIEKNLGKKMLKQPVPTGTEICRKQLFSLIDRMEKVGVNEDQIAPFMEVVNKKLEWLSKEQLIKHFVSLEFNRFLDYYKNSPDLNEQEETGPGKQRSRVENKRTKRQQGSKPGSYARFYINIGKKNGISPKHIIGLINDHTQSRNINIGAIDIENNFSFFETGNKDADKILKAFHHKTYKGNPLKVELAGQGPAKPENQRRKSHKY